MIPDAIPVGGARTVGIAQRIRREYMGEAAPVGFLPGERDLAMTYGVARTTVRRALLMLAAEGLVRPERGRGYRMMPRPQGGKRTGPVAYIVPAQETDWLRTWSRERLGVALQRVLLSKGFQAHVMARAGRSADAMATGLAETGVWGAVLAYHDSELCRSLARREIACVLMETADRDTAVDTVVQDNFGGGYQAAAHLIEKGHRRIGWFGSTTQGEHAMERFAGALSACLRHGLDLPSDLMCEPPRLTEASREAQWLPSARAFLERPDRPKAVLALWAECAVVLGRAARQLGLVVGRDVDLVAWGTEADYRHEIEREFGPGQAPPTVTWDTEDMARATVERLASLAREPGQTPLRIAVPTRLILPGQSAGE